MIQQPVNMIIVMHDITYYMIYYCIIVLLYFFILLHYYIETNRKNIQPIDTAAPAAASIGLKILICSKLLYRSNIYSKQIHLRNGLHRRIPCKFLHIVIIVSSSLSSSSSSGCGYGWLWMWVWICTWIRIWVWTWIGVWIRVWIWIW